MAKAIMETSPNINLIVSTDEIVRASHTGGSGYKYRVKGICTKMKDQNGCINELQEELTEYNTRLVEMKTRVAEVQDDMKEKYLSQIENLENIRNLFAVKYGRLNKSSGDVWGDLKIANEEAWSELDY